MSSGYPDDFSLPSSGVQRGSAMSEYGDPSTPQYPSIKSAYRTPDEEITYFPVLPLQPIAYEDAAELIGRYILSTLLFHRQPRSRIVMNFRLNYNESLVKEDWTTGLNGGELNVGPGFSDGGKIRLRVNNQLRYVTSKNVIGKMQFPSYINSPR